MTAIERPWYACTGSPCTCPKIGEPSCRHPFGCQAQGDGCIGPCPVTAAEAMSMEQKLHEDERTADDILADIRDLITVIDKQQPAYRYIRTRTLLDLIDGKAS